MSSPAAAGERPLTGRHVLIVPSWWPSRENPLAGIFFLDYARAFARAGARVGVLYADLLYPKEALTLGAGALAWVRPRVLEERLDGAIPVIRVRGLHTNLGKAVSRTQRFARWIALAYERYVAAYGRPDVVHAHSAIPAGWAALQATRGAPVPLVVTEHMGPFSLLLDPPPCGALTREALRAAAAIVAVSPNLRAQMIEAGVEGPIELIPNIAAEEMTPAPAPPLAPRADGRPTVRGVFVGRVESLKGARELGEAILELAGEPATRFEWIIAGRGPREASLRRRFAQSVVADRVRWLGIASRAQVAAALRESHFLVLPSYGENCPLAVIEALSVGRPVVGTLGTGTEHLVGDEDGVLCPPRDARALTQAIRLLASAYPRFDAAAIAARAHARFAGETVARRYAEIFDAAMASRPRLAGTSG